MITRMAKYKALRERIASENYQHQLDLQSNDPIIVKGALILEGFECNGNRAKK